VAEAFREMAAERARQDAPEEPKPAH
jgi:hypothetical protein